MKIYEIICDRCGKKQEVVTKNDIISSFAKVEIWGVGQSRTDKPQRMDFCEDCYVDFISFLESRRQE